MVLFEKIETLFNNYKNANIKLQKVNNNFPIPKVEKKPLGMSLVSNPSLPYFLKLIYDIAMYEDKDGNLERTYVINFMKHAEASEKVNRYAFWLNMISNIQFAYIMLGMDADSILSNEKIVPLYKYEDYINIYEFYKTLDIDIESNNCKFLSIKLIKAICDTPRFLKAQSAQFTQSIEEY
jgi:hypothetical protein